MSTIFNRGCVPLGSLSRKPQDRGVQQTVGLYHHSNTLSQPEFIRIFIFPVPAPLFFLSNLNESPILVNLNRTGTEILEAGHTPKKICKNNRLAVPQLEKL